MLKDFNHVIVIHVAFQVSLKLRVVVSVAYGKEGYIYKLHAHAIKHVEKRDR